MDALERYYQEYLMSYDQDSNYARYDMDAQMTKDRIEKILEKGYMNDEDVDFVMSILPDIECPHLKAEIEEYIERLVIL